MSYSIITPTIPPDAEKKKILDDSKFVLGANVPMKSNDNNYAKMNNNKSDILRMGI
jgi:hypothetical protein